MSDTNHRIMTGNWNFPPHVTEEEVVQMAQDFADGPDGCRYLDLHVRGASDDSFCLGFKYRLKGVRKKDHTDHFHKMREMIKDRFGKGVNWSVATPTTIIQQISL